MTKEQIWQSVILSEKHFTNDSITEEQVYEAMDAYAKQEAIAFATHVLNNVWNIHSGLTGSPWISNEDLYDQFLKHQNKGD